MGIQLPYAQWCLLVESIASAQVEVCRLHSRFDELVGDLDKDGGEQREAAYKFCGDFLVGMPDRVRALEGAIQRAAFLLAASGPDTLKRSMPLSDVKKVEDVLGRRASAGVGPVVAGQRRASGLGYVVVLGDRRRSLAEVRAAVAPLRRKLAGVPSKWQALPTGGGRWIVRCWGVRGGR